MTLVKNHQSKSAIKKTDLQHEEKERGRKHFIYLRHQMVSLPITTLQTHESLYGDRYHYHQQIMALHLPNSYYTNYSDKNPNYSSLIRIQLTNRMHQKDSSPLQDQLTALLSVGSHNSPKKSIWTVWKKIMTFVENDFIPFFFFFINFVGQMRLFFNVRIRKQP